MKLIRDFLGFILNLLDRLTTPRSLERTAEKQALVDKQTASLAIYEFKNCPFCIKVRRELKRLNLKIELRDAKNDDRFKNELIEKGGEYQVPCLKITEQGKESWMYESSDIVNYLRGRFLT